MNIIVHALSRSGSNHLLANLHYQPGFFAFSERVQFPIKIPKDSFGRRTPDSEKKLQLAKFYVWKWWRPNEKSEILLPDDVCIVNFRHPYSIWHSWMKRPHPKEITDSPMSIVPIYINFFNELANIKNHTNKILVIFHEDTLKSREETIKKILVFVNYEYQKIWNYNDFFTNDIPLGYGNYKADRKITLEEEINLWKEDKNDLVKHIQRNCEPSIELSAFLTYYLE